MRSVLGHANPCRLGATQAWFDFDFTKDDTEEKVLQGEMENSVVTKLHQILRPFLLRRLKADVELSVPKKYEYILFGWLSDWQRAMYSDLIKKQLKDSDGKEIRAPSPLPPGLGAQFVPCATPVPTRCLTSQACRTC